MRERIILETYNPIIQFQDLYQLDLLKRDIERNVNTYQELIDYFNYGKIILMYDKQTDQYENSQHEINKIEEITNSNDSIKIKEQKIIKLILFKCKNSTYYYSYLHKYGDQLEYSNGKSEQPVYQNDWRMEPLCHFTISTMSVSGLQYIIERGYFKEYEFKKNASIHTQCLQKQIIGNDWYQFIQLYNKQETIKVSNETYWYKVIFINLLLNKSNVDDIIDQLDLFKNYIFQKDTNFSKGILYNTNVYYDTINNFSTFKWCIQLLSNIKQQQQQQQQRAEKQVKEQSSSTLSYRDTAVNINIKFEICSIDEIDFILLHLKQTFSSIHSHLSFSSFSLANYFIDQMDLLFPDDQLFSNVQLLSNLVDRSIVECDVKTLVEISEKFNGEQFDFAEQIQFNSKTITPQQLIEFFNGLNSIGYKLFRKSKLFGIFDELLKYLNDHENPFKQDNLFNKIIRSIDFNSFINDSMYILLSSMVNFRVDLVKLILSSDRFTFNMKIYNDLIENSTIFKYSNPAKPSFKEGIELLEYLVDKLPNINEMDTLVNQLYKTTISQDITDYPIENLNSLIQIHHKLFTIKQIPLNVTILHLISWFKLKSSKIYGFIKQYSFFANYHSPLVAQLYFDQFPFTRIVSTDDSILVSELINLYNTYNKSNVNEYLSFLLQFNCFDKSISLILNQKLKNQKSKNKNNNLNPYVTMLFKSSITVLELLPLFQSSTHVPSLNISNLIQCSIDSDRLDIFIHLLSTNDNDTIGWFKYFNIIEKSMLDFLEYFLVNHLSLFLKLSSGENENIFDFGYPILKNNIGCCILLYNHLPSIFNKKLIESCSLSLDKFGNPLETIKYFKEIGIIN